jgi:hypothetical protein
MTFRFASGPLSVRGPVLEHERCGCLVAPPAVGKHERLAHPEGAEEGG